MELIEIIGLILVIVQFYFLYRLWKNKGSLKAESRILAMVGILLLPLFIMATANYHVFETSKTVKACMNCHVMKPMGNDMLNPSSQTLAARHVSNGWIKEDQCYGCHKDYGLNGTLKAKVDGYRHLMRYITETYEEPIAYRGEFNSMNCMGCHAGTPNFESHSVHEPVIANLAKEESTISCSNCHGRAHPTRGQRTPGSPDYEKLMSENHGESLPDSEVEAIKQWLAESE